MPQYLKYFLIYFAVVAAVSVLLTAFDKFAAKKRVWRVPEATLMLAGLLGGALPMFITMKLIRHKTKHKKFMIGLPAEFILHAVICVVAIYFMYFR